MKWEDYDLIAEALSEKYKEIDLVNLTDEELIDMVFKLDDFEEKGKKPDGDIISAVINFWAKFEDGSYDDSGFDAYV